MKTLCLEGSYENRMNKLDQFYDGQWIEPVRKGFVVECCGCGLRHVMNFKLVKRGKVRKIQFQASRVMGKRNGRDKG